MRGACRSVPGTALGGGVVKRRSRNGAAALLPPIGLFVLRFAQNVVEFAGSLVFVELLVESVHHLHGYIHRGAAYEYGVFVALFWLSMRS